MFQTPKQVFEEVLNFFGWATGVLYLWAIYVYVM